MLHGKNPISGLRFVRESIACIRNTYGPKNLCMVLLPICNIFAIKSLYKPHLHTVMTDKSSFALLMAWIPLPLNSGNIMWLHEVASNASNISNFSADSTHKYWNFDDFYFSFLVNFPVDQLKIVSFLKLVVDCDDINWYSKFWISIWRWFTFSVSLIAYFLLKLINFCY